MRRIIALVVLAVAIGGCQVSAEPVPDTQIVELLKERPTVNIPPGLRERNWLGPQREGSCVHATLISLLRWQGRYNMATFWRQKYADGETADRYYGNPRSNLADKMEREGLRYAYTVGKGDVKFLEWACNTRRGCGVAVMGGRHMVALVHLDEHWAGILDNNRTSRFIWMPRRMFIAEWLNSGSWAFSPIYNPPPPMPQ